MLVLVLLFVLISSSYSASDGIASVFCPRSGERNFGSSFTDPSRFLSTEKRTETAVFTSVFFVWNTVDWYVFLQRAWRAALFAKRRKLVFFSVFHGFSYSENEWFEVSILWCFEYYILCVFYVRFGVFFFRDFFCSFWLFLFAEISCFYLFCTDSGTESFLKRGGL